VIPGLLPWWELAPTEALFVRACCLLWSCRHSPGLLLLPCCLQVEGPKTIEEIHREEAMKRSRSAMLDRQGGGGGSFRGQRGGPPPA
jgi:hypothetical protein